MPEFERELTVSRIALLELKDEQRLVNEGYELLDEKRILLATEIRRQLERLRLRRAESRKAEDAARAAGMAEPRTRGSVVASDAFFPFADGLLAAAEAGATAIIQPGGSLRDKEVIAAADEATLAMVFTGVRHFRH